MADESYIPVYLPDRTVIGKGKVDGQFITIELDEGDAIQTLFKEELLGMSFVYMSAKAQDIVDDKRHELHECDCIEPTCTYPSPHNHGVTCYVGCSVCN